MSAEKICKEAQQMKNLFLDMAPRQVTLATVGVCVCVCVCVVCVVCVCVCCVVLCIGCVCVLCCGEGGGGGKRR